MKVINIPRGAGKTTMLIDWLREDEKRIVITFSKEEAIRLGDIYKDVANRIMAWGTYRDRGNHIYGKANTEVAIDNLDMIIQRMIPAPITIVTLTKEE